MQTIKNMTVDDFKQIIKDSVKETLSDKKIKKIFLDIVEDLSLGKAIEEGLKTDTIESKKLLKKLQHRIQPD
jgi:hypothetical protein